jgi:hypothetical protein
MTAGTKAEIRRSQAQCPGVKQQKPLRKITKRGAVFVRHGANHDVYENRRTNVSTQVPLHNDEAFPKLQFLGKLPWILMN